MRSSALLLLVLVACASNPVPDDKILAPQQVPTWTRGMYVVVELARVYEEAAGELLAANEAGLWVLVDGKAAYFRRDDVLRAVVCAFDSSWGTYGVWTGIGTASTISHGVVLFISAPIWLLVGTVATVSAHNRPIFTYPEDPIGEFAKWARFPQGLPEGFVR